MGGHVFPAVAGGSSERGADRNVVIRGQVERCGVGLDGDKGAHSCVFKPKTLPAIYFAP